LAEKFLGITDEEELKALGFDGWSQFETGFKQGLEGWDPSIYSDSVNEKYAKIVEGYDLDPKEFEARKG
jgi:hypothetical protein